jgi:hypothetical protein
MKFPLDLRRKKMSLIFPFWQGLWVPDEINYEAKNSPVQRALRATI